MSPVARALEERFDEVCRSELGRLRRKTAGLAPEDSDAVHYLSLEVVHAIAVQAGATLGQPGADELARAGTAVLRGCAFTTMTECARRSARDTCEQCHWPEKFHGDKVELRREYASDEANSETVTTLRVHVGGGSEKLGIATGIHWHMNVANQVEYVATDDKRQTIPWVRLTDRQGRVREFRAPDVTDETLARGERRRMDCMDCHNRPSHPFNPSPERAVDAAIALGDISRQLPFIRREAVAALTERYENREVAEVRIAERLVGFYAKSYPAVAGGRSPALDRAVRRTQELYRRNVFPRMNVWWGTYVNNIGHSSGPGCFRCHDDNHKSSDGAVIGQDCELCHMIE